MFVKNNFDDDENKYFDHNDASDLLKLIIGDTSDKELAEIKKIVDDEITGRQVNA